ncbi:RAMP superfamily CRISPR-associated protein [Nostoc sp. FACHB-190]|uniref:RAMP superfamily CRISPR-associated protein n=1 Tax=Nostoc sp. FACHB-190 TaxID=2692838 RepID=UPI001686D260|nr:RAMP superfamily CRISPR-associated protein [Nostoc sp. FACHB-190]MBD2298840.1 CRISPR-associated protein [Nostoc sp. FACHB-190]
MARNSSRSQNFGGSNQERGPRPYDFVYFPTTPPTQNQPPGHHKYLPNHLHGTLFLTLTVQTTLHISTGVVLLGEDINQADIPLIKTMVQGNDNELLIQGSSLKGCIRSVYEAITNSRVGVKPKQPNEYPEERLPAKEKNQLCPASIVFGASGEKWGWQGLITIQDAHCEITGSEVGFMPNLWRPRPDENQAYYNNDGKTVGWKFYYNMKNSIDKGLDNGIPVQVAFRNDEFSTQLNFKNLKPEELGALLIALGQDKNYPLVLKVGAGKPIGMGSMTVAITEAEIVQNQADLYNRYTSLSLPSSQLLTDESLQAFIQSKIQQAHEALIAQTQLQKLSEILNSSTNRIPYESY